MYQIAFFFACKFLTESADMLVDRIKARDDTVKVFLKLLGFSLGDELGLAESLGNLEANKRRSLNVRTSNPSVIAASQTSVSI